MKRCLLTWLCCLSAVALCAQSQDDPVLMTVNGMPVLRSEFVSSYHRNNVSVDGERLSVSEFLDRFTDYKLKLAAAADAGYTLPSLAQPAPEAMPVAFNRAEAEAYYRQVCTAVGNRDMLHLAQVLLRVDTRASSSEVSRVRLRIDSVSQALSRGAVFADLARQVSQDAHAANGGDMGWVGPNQLLADMERVAYALRVGEVSEPFLTPAGWHVMKMLDRQPVTSEVVRQWFLTPPTAGGQQVLPPVNEELTRECQEGLLVSQMTQAAVWNQPLPDEDDLMRYFKKNKKRYGKKLKKRDFPTYRDLVLADYQQHREQEWVEGLRRQYKVKVNKSVLRTIE